VGEPAATSPDPLETVVDAAIAVCDGDMRAALRAALIYNEFLERKLEMMRGMISSGYTRGQVAPGRQAADQLEKWRDISSGTES
jgi:hypothetical protein